VKLAVERIATFGAAITRRENIRRMADASNAFANNAW